MTSSPSSSSGMGRTALVTGAGGFLGSHLVETLVARGWRVRALLHYNAAGHMAQFAALADDVRAAVEVVQGDVRDSSQMIDVVRGVDCVFHLAALIAVPYSFAAPRQYVETNVTGALNILEAARAMETPPRVLLASSSEVYGSAVTLPIREDHALQPQSPYAASKVAADQLALSYQRTYDLPVALIRPFNAFGPRQSTRAVIPTIVQQVLTQQTESIALGALDTRRDFVWARDIAEGYAMAADAPDDICGQVFHLATGRMISVGDLAERISRIAGRPDIRITQEPQRLRPSGSEVAALQGEADRALRAFGWAPGVGLDEGLTQIVEAAAEQQTRYQGWVL